MKSYYSSLEIDQSASVAEIKRAYFRLVRQYSPEKFPEEFMEIRKAYEVLSVDEMRKAYDDMMAHFNGLPEEVGTLLMEASMLFARNEKNKAVAMVERCISNFPDDSAASKALKNDLCIMYLEMERSGKAVALAEELVSLEPDNAEYKLLAAAACMARGWKTKASVYLGEAHMSRLRSEDAMIPFLELSDDNPYYLGQIIESIEEHGGKAPLICLTLLNKMLADEDDIGSTPYYEQMGIYPEDNKNPQPWADLQFVARKLAEHTIDFDYGKTEYFRDVLESVSQGVLGGIYYQDRYDIVPFIEQVIENIGALDILDGEAFGIVSLGYSAMQAVAEGIPKPLVLLSVLQYFTQSDYIEDSDKKDYRQEIPFAELDIILEYEKIKPDIRRFRNEFPLLHRHSAGFLNGVMRYSEQKAQDEARRRLGKMPSDSYRISFNWLGEEDDIELEEIEDDNDGVFNVMSAMGIGERQEPVRVVKVSRNAPCPCGSGLKYKRCCGK